MRIHGGYGCYLQEYMIEQLYRDRLIVVSLPVTPGPAAGVPVTGQLSAQERRSHQPGHVPAAGRPHRKSRPHPPPSAAPAAAPLE